MQCLWLVLPDFDPQRNGPVLATIGDFDSVNALEESLFGACGSGSRVADLSPGLFNSQAVGGVNASSRDSTDASSNPWDYLFMMEGLLLFAGAMSKRTGALSPVAATFPFTVRLSAAGAGSLIPDESQNREVWLPIWTNPSSQREMTTIFAEARLTVGNRFAATGLDAALALSSFGVDRGIGEYERFGIVKGRVGGDNYHSAVSLGRWKTHRAEQVDLVSEFYDWLQNFRRGASAENAPTQARRALRALETCILDLCRESDAQRCRLQTQAILIALGNAEASLAKSKKWREEAFQNPVPFLSDAWLAECDDGTSEFRVAASLAGMYAESVGGFRQYLEPINLAGRLPGWSEDSGAQANVVWSADSLDKNLAAVLCRRVVQAVQHGERTGDKTLVFPGKSRFHAALGDLSRFLSGETDDARIAGLCRGLSLLDWRRIDKSIALQRGKAEPVPHATFALLKLCHAGYHVRDVDVRLQPSISRLAIGGRLEDATRTAVKRLKASGLPPALAGAARGAVLFRRIAAALVIPLGLTDVQTLADSVLASNPEVEVVLS